MEFSYNDFNNLRSRLSKTIQNELQNSSMEERVWFARTWSEILATIAPNVEIPTEEKGYQAFMTCVSLIESNRNSNMYFDICPQWMNSSFEAIYKDSEKMRPAPTHGQTQQHYVEETDVDKYLTGSDEFWEWAENSIKRKLERRLVSTYIYYYANNQRCAFHIDTPSTFEYNCLIGIEHKHQLTQKSILKLITAESQIDVALEPRSAFIFHSSSTVHGRTPLQIGEQVTVLSLGLTSL